MAKVRVEVEPEHPYYWLNLTIPGFFKLSLCCKGDPNGSYDTAEDAENAANRLKSALEGCEVEVVG